jgi:hypothetical protein
VGGQITQAQANIGDQIEPEQNPEQRQRPQVNAENRFEPNDGMPARHCPGPTMSKGALRPVDLHARI